MLNRISMKFDRKLFKEAFKAGYKKAKFLNEDTNVDSNKGGFARNLSTTIFKKYGDYCLKAAYFRKTGENYAQYEGNYSVYVYVDEFRFHSLPLGDDYDPKGVAHESKNFNVSGKDVKKVKTISDQEVRVFLKNGDFFELQIYVIINPSEVL